MEKRLVSNEDFKTALSQNFVLFSNLFSNYSLRYLNFEFSMDFPDSEVTLSVFSLV